MVMDFGKANKPNVDKHKTKMETTKHVNWLAVEENKYQNKSQIAFINNCRFNWIFRIKD